MELVNQRRNNSIRFPKRKYILINIVTIIFYFFFIYYNDSNDLNIDVNNSAINEISPLIFIRKKNDKVTDDIKLSNLLTYNNEIYQITREKFLYEKQKQLIFLSLANHIFKGTWTNSSSNEILGESTINFEKALERKTLSEVLYLKIINMKYLIMIKKKIILIKKK